MPLIEVPKVSQYDALIKKFSKKYNVPYDLVYNTIRHESAGDPNAFNGSNNENSRGLMQISQGTAISPPLNIPFMLIDRLYEPEYNIEQGTKYLKFIHDYLKPYMKTKDTKLMWLIVSSSYNQGMGYYKKALQYINENGEPYTWEHVKYRVLHPIGSTRTPWKDNVLNYADRIVGVLENDSFKTAMVATPLIIGSAMAGIYFFVIRKA